MKRREVTEVVQSAARDVLRLLKEGDGASSTELAERLALSRETIKRALEWLRDQGARIEYVARDRALRLEDPTFALPLLDPTLEDLQAAMTAAGLLQALQQERAAARAWALFNELEGRLFAARGRPIRRDALRVTQSASFLRDPKWMLTLLRAAGRGVVRVGYRSPWKNVDAQHTFEPWQVGLHDGAMYVRGYSRTRCGARTFNVAHIVELSVVPGERPRVRAPRSEVWGEEDPRLGIDVDRPGTARLEFRGAVARWVAGARWHVDQTDEWRTEGEQLIRTLPFRSCRELARRLASVADGLVQVEPPELAAELQRLLDDGAAALRGGATTA